MTYNDKHAHPTWVLDNVRPCMVRLDQPNGFSYTPEVCEEMFYNGSCSEGKLCSRSHSSKERKVHPLVFKTLYCDKANCEGTAECYWKAHYRLNDLRSPQDPLGDFYARKRDDKFWKLNFKVKACERKNCRIAPLCHNYHNPNERRRDITKFSYTAEACANVRKNGTWLRPSLCPEGDSCSKCHTYVELMFHEKVFKSHHCQRYPFCKYGVYCTHKHCPKTTNAHNAKYSSRRKKVFYEKTREGSKVASPLSMLEPTHNYSTTPRNRRNRKSKTSVKGPLTEKSLNENRTRASSRSPFKSPALVKSSTFASSNSNDKSLFSKFQHFYQQYSHTPKVVDRRDLTYETPSKPATNGKNLGNGNSKQRKSWDTRRRLWPEEQQFYGNFDWNKQGVLVEDSWRQLMLHRGAKGLPEQMNHW